MASKVTKTMKTEASGILSIDGERITIDVEDVGEFELHKLLKNFDGCSVKITCSYDEDQESPEEPEVDTDTVELVD